MRSITLEADALIESDLILPLFTVSVTAVELVPEFAVAVSDTEDK